MRPSFLLVFFSIFCFLFLLQSASAQTTDTLKITLAQAEDQFLKNNLQLVIERYNIDNASAEIITARLFQNPNFSYNNGLYATGVPNAYSEQSFGLSQLFSIAGKRNKNVQLAKLGVEQAKYQFFDLLRTLKFTLRNDISSSNRPRYTTRK
jgi:cobalt-zinc-cadmium efflux system outer membrane protein